MLIKKSQCSVSTHLGNAGVAELEGRLLVRVVGFWIDVFGRPEGTKVRQGELRHVTLVEVHDAKGFLALKLALLLGSCFRSLASRALRGQTNGLGR